MDNTMALLVNYRYCSGCHSCEIACRNEHDLPRDKFGIKVHEQGPWEIAPGKWDWDYLAVPTSLCDACKERTEDGLEPMCVQSCQAKVIECGTLEEMAKRAAELGTKTALYVL